MLEYTQSLWFTTVGDSVRFPHNRTFSDPLLIIY